MVNFENLLATLLYKIRPFGQASDRASDTFGHCSVFSFSWKSLKMEPKKEPKDPQTIHEYLLLLLSTHQALKLKLWHVLKMSTNNAPLGFEEALPFGQASDKLRTTFGHFLPCSKRYLATGRAGVPAEAWVSTYRALNIWEFSLEDV